MNAVPHDTHGCGQASCQCATGAPTAQASDASGVARINGVALHDEGQVLPDELLRERAWCELLRQQAVALGCLPAHGAALAPGLDKTQQQAIEQMLEREVTVPQPDEPSCQRYYEAHKRQFVIGQALHVRHILFAVTPGVNVHALSLRAESALLELLRKEVPSGRFEQLARELSNCPSGAQGGDLGWLTPNDCAPELANELFFQQQAGWGLGVHPRLVHTRYGLHIVEVLARKAGKQLPFDEVREQIATRLAEQARSTALHQYMQLLVGAAQIEGVSLQGADTPLVQ